MHHNPILALLDGVKRTGANSYKARCPHHDDRDPSLAVTIAEDGRILMHCFAGCSAGEIMSSLGLGLADLFPDGAIDHRLKGAAPWVRPRRRAEEKKENHYQLVIEAAETQRRKGKRLTPSQLKEEREAFLALRESKKCQYST